MQTLNKTEQITSLQGYRSPTDQCCTQLQESYLVKPLRGAAARTKLDYIEPES